MTAPNTWFNRLTQQQRWFSPAGLLSSGAWFWWRDEAGWPIGLFAPDPYSGPFVLRSDDDRARIDGFRAKAFSTAISLGYDYVSTYSGSSAVALTDGGGHAVGPIGVLVFPAGTASSVTWPGAWAVMPGSESFTNAEACAVFVRVLDRMHVTLKRVILI
mgnify:FL=1